MPWYRINGTTVHVRGTKLPPACCAPVGVKASDGQAMEICLAPSAFLCDGPGEGRRTCDRPLCEAHARQIGVNRHLCPAHHVLHLDEQAQFPLFTHLVES